MKYRIAVCVSGIALSVLSVSLGGCSGNSSQSTGKDTSSIIEESSGNSPINLPNSENSKNVLENSSSLSETSSDKSDPENEQPSGTPTIFTGPDEKPVYDYEVTKITSDYPDFSKTAAELTAEDEGVTIFCEGFQYFKEPGGAAYSSYENPEMFDGAEFKNEMPENKNAWKRINVGDEICGLKLKSATSAFNNYSQSSFDAYQTYYTCDVPDFFQFAEFEGSVTITGFLNSSCRSSYEPDGGKLRLTPTENKLPVMPASFMFKIQPETYMAAQSYGGGEMYVVNEINEIGIDNPSELDLGCIGIGDTAFARLTISDIKYLVGGKTVTATLDDIEILSDVLAHEDDLI